MLKLAITYTVCIEFRSPHAVKEIFGLPNQMIAVRFKEQFLPKVKMLSPAYSRSDEFQFSLIDSNIPSDLDTKDADQRRAK